MMSQKDLQSGEDEVPEKGIGFLFFGFVLGLVATYGFFVHSQSQPGSRMPAQESATQIAPAQITQPNPMNEK